MESQNIAEQLEAVNKQAEKSAALPPPPVIGSAEAAVLACVSLMASVMGQREELLAYWLDLYYQVRAVYERENAAEPDPTVLRRGDLYPVLRELMQDALKSAVRGEAAARMERKKAGNRPSQSAAPQASSECRTLPARQDALPEGASQVLTDSHEPQCGSRNDEEDGAAQADESAPPSESTLSGFSPVKIEPDRGGWKRKKAAIRDRLVSARAEGMTIPQLVEASGGKLEDEDIFGILNAAKTDMSIYRSVEAALDVLGK